MAGPEGRGFSPAAKRAKQGALAPEAVPSNRVGGFVR
jgi:hypothetical protein